MRRQHIHDIKCAWVAGFSVLMIFLICYDKRFNNIFQLRISKKFRLKVFVSGHDKELKYQAVPLALKSLNECCTETILQNLIQRCIYRTVLDISMGTNYPQTFPCWAAIKQRHWFKERCKNLNVCMCAAFERIFNMFSSHVVCFGQVPERDIRPNPNVTFTNFWRRVLAKMKVIL